MFPWQTLAGRLFNAVLVWYLLLAAGVTAFQLGAEYVSVRRANATELRSLAHAFSPPLAEAIWAVDKPVLNSLLQGLRQTNVVTGIAIESVRGERLAVAGEVPNTAPSEDWLAPYQMQVETLMHVAPPDQYELVGYLKIYSNRSTVINRINSSSRVLLINVVVETLGLWLIFYAVMKLRLTRTLSRLASTVAGWKFDSADAQEKIEYPHDDELGTLVDALNKSRQRLADSMRQLNELNQNLEKIVEQRTQELQEVLGLNQGIIGNSSIGILAYRADGRCVMANAAAAAIVGMSQDKLLRLNFRQMENWKICKADVLAERTLVTGLPHFLESQYTTAFGKILWARWAFSSFRSHGEPHLLLMLEDVTEQKQAHDALENLSRRDALTGVLNRRGFEENLQAEWQASSRTQTALALVLIDVDFFKNYNDSYGHQAGDECLRRVAQALVRVARRTGDCVSRYGGEEFAVLLPNTDLAGAVRMASEMRVVIEGLGISHESSPAPKVITVSLGVAAWVAEPRTTHDTLVSEADRQLYRAKQEGRNRVAWDENLYVQQADEAPDALVGPET